MKTLTTFVTAAALAVLAPVFPTHAEDKRPMKVITDPKVKTDHMGGIPVPSTEVLKKMHQGQYILRARGGELTKVPVEKNVLPRDPKINPQGVVVDIGPDH